MTDTIERERPEGCRFWVAEDVTGWIYAHLTPTELKELGHESAEKAAIWWLADMQEEAYRDLSHRERMEVLVDGIRPLTLDDITDELWTRLDDADHGVAECDRTVEAELTDFFLSPNRGFNAQ